MDLMTNFVPFETITLYLRCLRYNYIGMAIPMTNLFGNFMLFMPMALLLPCLFSSMRTWWRFCLLMPLMLLAVEGLQLILCCGSCDVDDVILNLSGTLLVYFLIRIPAITRLLEKLYLMPPKAAAA
jgi:glycopeptide antibiotics resistance protein